MDWGQKREELDEDAKEASEGLEGNGERPIPPGLRPKFPFCDTNHSLWARLSLLFRLVDLQAQSSNAHPLTPRVTLPKVELMSTPYCRQGTLPIYPPNC